MCGCLRKTQGECVMSLPEDSKKKIGQKEAGPIKEWLEVLSFTVH